MYSRSTCKKSSFRPEIIGWFLGLFAVVVYLLTLSPTVNFWDCGEFIATGNTLMISHAPGAPFYSLILHLFALLGGSFISIAWWCNALSAIATAFTVTFLYWSLLLILPKKVYSVVAAVVGALCYLLCDTVWVSATETEVYSFAVLMCSIIVWCMLRWRYEAGQTGSSRWLVLVSLLMGLSLCVHLLCLLVVPFVACIYFTTVYRCKANRIHCNVFLILFFILGLTPYLIVPIRATANPPVNCGNPSSVDAFWVYVSRGQYEKQPLYPRIWRHRPNDDIYASEWSGGNNNMWGNVRFALSYQMCYMNLRYFMWNFSGRFNDLQGYGSLQNGQFVTGIGFIDRLLVGTDAGPPDSVAAQSHNVYFMLPFILGLLGILSISLFDKGVYWSVLLLFLFGGVLLSGYLNIQAYEPRERDYIFVLSYYAFTIFIAMGAYCVIDWVKGLSKRYSNLNVTAVCLMLLSVPALMAFQNWDDHDRSNDYTAYYSARNLLNTCSSNSMLFTFGDNDTYPLWYMQYVEGYRNDVKVYNINLLGSSARFFDLLNECRQVERPAFFSHYAYDAMPFLNDDNCMLAGYGYRLVDSCYSGSDYIYATLNLLENTEWSESSNDFHDDVSIQFIEMYWRDVLSATQQTLSVDTMLCCNLLAKSLKEAPVSMLRDDTLRYNVVERLAAVGMREEAVFNAMELKSTLIEQLEYYSTMNKQNRFYLSNMLGTKRDVLDKIQSMRL